MSEPAWKAANHAHWDEKVALHLGPRGYDLTGVRAGRGRLNAIEEAELWPVDGSRVLHLQCHFGADTLALAQRGAIVVGLDFSSPAIAAADRLAAEVRLADRARFVQADLYDAPAAIPEPAAFDMVFVTWGAISWLPDGRPGFFAPYFSREPVVMDEAHDYVDETAKAHNATTYTWIHPLSDIISNLMTAGLVLDWFHEHDAVTWRMFKILAPDADGLWRWPDRPWLPLAFSLRATRR